MSLLMKKRVLAAKIETTIGTAIALGNADGAENVFNAKLSLTSRLKNDQGKEDLAGLGAFQVQGLALRLSARTFTTTEQPFHSGRLRFFLLAVGLLLAAFTLLAAKHPEATSRR
jgi:hypothetical protein